ncbi:SHOCT domain-containing protein [Enterococcus faecalis]|uniref:SHOCT domain-containing protein n=1 Tax=Enterococcus faecalis TaxID=1351 RepID=UPI00033064B7|nr:SHOCT domain-containing protein [Enterococcus faecalis]EGO7725479.1 SHOCT domain-containing protein [Enterococcus faecalis]EGO8644187.1 SHOCT domain-containing protein [Enterococcus faecalis]EGS8308130.1 SHOCT domain-containing protein [Enterococcus faecalis]EJG4466687.1 SHOCT domain-containing protein [Enterococcus faecalis]EJI7180130.1 SHOCT domain-containing protein [Enterococcus faecalis]
MDLFNKMKEVANNQYKTLKNKEISGNNIGEIIKPIENVANTALSNYEENKKEQKLVLSVKKSFSKKLDSIVLRRDINNYFYISKNYNPDAIKYLFERFEWNGSTTTQKTITKGDIKTKGRTGKTVVGAALLGPVGAIIGSSGKRKSKIDTESTTTTTEIGSEGKIFLRNPEDNSIKEIKVFLNSAQANNLERFIANIEYSDPKSLKTSKKSSTTEQLKELKELLDSEVITQEEFELKKRELLDIHC